MRQLPTGPSIRGIEMGMPRTLVSSSVTGVATADRVRHRHPRPQSAALALAALFPQRPHIVGAAVDVVEHRARQPALRSAPEVFDIDDVRGPNFGHGW